MNTNTEQAAPDFTITVPIDRPITAARISVGVEFADDRHRCIPVKSLELPADVLTEKQAVRLIFIEENDNDE